jgi:hypothetical protein
MLKTVLVALGIAVLGYAAYGWATGGGAPADPLTASAALDLKVKAQAGITIAVTGLDARMKQLMATGDISQEQATTVRADAEALHRDVGEARRQLLALGDQPQDIERWQVRIGWPRFLETEARFAAATAGK